MQDFFHLILVGGWTNPSEKYESNWKSSPNRGDKKYLKPQPRISTCSINVTTKKAQKDISWWDESNQNMSNYGVHNMSSSKSNRNISTLNIRNIHTRYDCDSFAVQCDPNMAFPSTIWACQVVSTMSHDGSVGRLYIYLHEGSTFMVNV